MSNTIMALSLKYAQDNQDKYEDTFDQPQRLEAKFIVLCKVAFNMKFYVTNGWSDDEKEYVEESRSLGPPCTSSNLIMLEEDMVMDIKGKAKLHETSSHARTTKSSSHLSVSPMDLSTFWFLAG